MKLLSISTDRNLFVPQSAVSQRQIEYAKNLQSLTIIVFTPTGYTPRVLSENCRVIPTNSLLKFFRILDAAFISRGIDFTHITAQDPFETGLCAAWIKRRTKKPLEIQIHTDLFSPFFYKGGFLNRIRVVLARAILPKADTIRVVAESIALRLKTTFGSSVTKNIEVRPVFVDTQKCIDAPITFDCRKEFPQFSKHIIMVGRLEREKNQELGIRAFALAVKENSKVGLVVVGGGSYMAKLRAICSDLKITDHVKFLGNRNDVASIMKTSDALLQTSWYEGNAMVFMEANACKLPIISTDVSSAQEHGALITDFTPESISKAILSLS